MVVGRGDGAKGNPTQGDGGVGDAAKPRGVSGRRGPGGPAFLGKPSGTRPGRVRRGWGRGGPPGSGSVRPKPFTPLPGKKDGPRVREKGRRTPAGEKPGLGGKNFGTPGFEKFGGPGKGGVFQGSGAGGVPFYMMGGETRKRGGKRWWESGGGLKRAPGLGAFWGAPIKGGKGGKGV